MRDDTLRAREEDLAIHRSRCAVTGVIDQLRTLGLYETVIGADGKPQAVKLDPDRRRNLLVFISELEEHVKALEHFKADLANSIERANSNMAAVSAYQTTSRTVRSHARNGRQ